MATRKLTIAIDGPSGAGKGTVARAVADQLGYRHVDTGAMYRAVGWLAHELGIPLEDEDAVAALAVRSRMDLAPDSVLIDGHDVTRAIRTPDIDRAASAVARLPRVREALVARQRALGAEGGVVMEGRDIGTVVFPAADVKIYLDASPDERAKRRASDPAHEAGARQASVSSIAVELAARDKSDSTRQASPLSVAADAHVIDTTWLGIAEVVRRVMAIVKEKA